MPYRLSPVTPSRRTRRCGSAGRRIRRRGWVSRAVSSVAGHGVRDDRRVPYHPSPDHVRSGPSRAVWPVAGSRPVEIVACGIARRWARHEGWSSRAVRSVAGSRLVLFLPVSATSESLPWSWSGERNARRRPCPGPTAAGSRRRHRRLTNIYSFIQPPRFIVARSAARLRRIVGPLASRTAVAGQTRQRDIIGHNRA